MKKITQTIDSLGPNPTQGQVAAATESRCSRSLRVHIISGEGVAVHDEILGKTIHLTNEEALSLAKYIRTWLHDGGNG